MSELMIYPDNLFFWESALKESLMPKRCKSCNDFHWFPRSICPLCGSDDTYWFPSHGKGKIYSLTVTRKAGPIPYALAYVTLEEGVTLMSNIVDCDLDKLRIGDEVQVVFKTSPSGQAVPMFKPIK